MTLLDATKTGNIVKRAVLLRQNILIYGEFRFFIRACEEEVSLTGDGGM